MADPEVIHLPEQRKPMPVTIVIPGQATEGMTPNELKAVKAASGLRLDYLMGDEADLDEKAQLGVWIALTRAGYEPTWEEAANVRPVDEPVMPDPTSSGP